MVASELLFYTFLYFYTFVVSFLAHPRVCTSVTFPIFLLYVSFSPVHLDDACSVRLYPFEYKTKVIFLSSPLFL